MKSINNINNKKQVPLEKP